MTNDTVAARRAALLRACRVLDFIVDVDRFGVPTEDVFVSVDDAAACMAERERVLREAGERLARNLRIANGNACGDEPTNALRQWDAALAAVQERT